ncbi:hypothetical protein DFP97_10566 [Paenibacillus prosopidis]|uniref:Uncharacterized protein n=1 Tax=Paenibacillus prosopidis TaxID=630520 RepID=A0A368W6S1_9BACL|nr:hypothetical protein DFP97_10566 [Paenibacillus prosopidis]
MVAKEVVFKDMPEGTEDKIPGIHAVLHLNHEE